MQGELTRAVALLEQSSVPEELGRVVGLVVRTAERLAASLQQEEDPQRLDAIALAVVRCETGDELIRQTRSGLPDA